jgi:UDP-glucose 4-epimerase
MTFVLVTGSAGLVGKALVDRLESLGISHLAMDHSVFNLAGNRSLIEFVAAPPSTIIHLAAAVPHGLGRKDDQVAADETRRIDENVAKAALAWNSRVVYASSCLLYDRTDSSVKYESSPVSARKDSPYSAAKLAGEQVIRSLPDSLIFRLSAPVGVSMNQTLVLAKFIQAAVARRPLEVWGTGLREQDFIDVSDVTNFLVAASTAKNLPAVLNLVSSTFVTMKNLADLVVKTLGGSDIRISKEPDMDPLDGEYARYSNQLACQSLGWSPSKKLSVSIEEIGAHFAKNN